MQRTVLLTASIFILAIWGCKKTDTTAPSISITNPAYNSIDTEQLALKPQLPIMKKLAAWSFSSMVI